MDLNSGMFVGNIEWPNCSILPGGGDLRPSLFSQSDKDSICPSHFEVWCLEKTYYQVTLRPRDYPFTTLMCNLLNI